MRYRKAVFIVTYAKTKKGVEYLILKRKLHWTGWEFPKGAMNFLEKKKGAIKRELKEETGLVPLKGSIKKFNYSGKYEYSKIHDDRPQYKGQTFTLYSVEVKKPAKGKIKIDELEHSNFKWIDYKAARRMLTWPNQKESLKIVNDWLKGSAK